MILAVCPDEHFRDGEKAIEHATRACELTQWREMICLNTLAAAYAEVGKFDKAVEFENKALEMATKDADKKRYHDRLRLYQSGKPYRETHFE